MQLTQRTAAPLIDHTLLKAAATKKEIEALCAQAAQFGFASVCVNPVWVSHAAACLTESPVKVCTVIGFPLGASASSTKAFEAEQAVKDGADEVDMVINIGAALDGQYDTVAADIRAVCTAARQAGRDRGVQVIVKVIIETCFLTDDQIKETSLCAKRSGADFVKTSTGFGTGGAQAAHVSLMRKTVGNEMGIKASGGIRNAADARLMIEAGANRLGTSAGVQILSGLPADIP